MQAIMYQVASRFLDESGCQSVAFTVCERFDILLKCEHTYN